MLAKQEADERSGIGSGPTLADVAAAVGLHPSTVSRALDPRRASMVKEPTRELIVAAAEKVGYRPNLAARSLMTGRTSTIAVIAADLGNPWVTPIIHGIASRMSVEGIVPIVAESNDDSRVLSELVDHMVSRRVDALIILAARRADAGTAVSAARLLPTVVAARPLLGLPVASVRSDDRRGGEMIGTHFADLGHRLVAQLRGPSDVANFPLRDEGFVAAIEARGVEQIRMEAEAHLPVVEDGAALMRELLDRAGSDRPTAIFAHNDNMAAGALSVIRERGLDVPGDLAIAGYNNTPLTEYLTPGLTTVRYPGWEVGREAAALALRIMDGEKELETIQIEPELVVRGSTDPAA